jgi:hypothetical protein
MAAPAGPAVDPVRLPTKSEKWVEVRTRNFTLYGNASDSKIKEVGLEMERLRAVLVALKRGSGTAATAPTRIYVFKSHPAMKPYLPRDAGDPDRMSSFYMGGGDASYMMFTAAWNEDPRPTVYHSYIYDFINANFEGLPLWYETGIAGYYSTFQTEGDEASTGIVHDEYLARLLSRGMWIPLDRLLAVDYESPEYRDSEKKSLFFAETWALVHYLMQGNPTRAPQLGRYLTLVREGRPRDEAFREAFGTDYATLYGELHGYIRNNRRFLHNRFLFAKLDPPTEAATKPLSYEDVVVRLGDLLAYLRRLPEAERYYEAVLTTNPSSAGALAGLAWVRRRQERKDEAGDLTRRAAAAGSTDFRVYYDDGLRRWEEIGPTYDARNADQRALLEAARAAFRKSADLNPDFAEALAMFGRSYRYEPPGANVDEGIAALEQAKVRLPNRPDVAADLAALQQHKNRPAPEDALGVPATAPEAGRAASNSLSGFDAGVAEVNRLVERRQYDEAIKALDRLIPGSDEETKTQLERYREKLVRQAASTRAGNAYNAALALYNKRDYRGALAAFRKVASESADADMARAARQKADEISRLLAGTGSAKP